MATCARCARGARSPEAPTEPCDGITGCTPLFNMAQRVSARTGRTPEKPLAMALARSASIARVSRSLKGAPTPQAWLRTRFTCSARICSREIRTEAIFPKPVLTPYTAASDSIRRSTTARERFMRSRACGDSSTCAPSSTTLYSCSSVKLSPSIWIGFIGCALEKTFDTFRATILVFRGDRKKHAECLQLRSAHRMPGLQPHIQSESCASGTG